MRARRDAVAGLLVLAVLAGVAGSASAAGRVAVASASAASGMPARLPAKFDGEHGGAGSDGARTTVIEYGMDSSFLSVAGWSGPGVAFAGTLPVTAGVSGADRNTVAVVRGRGAAAADGPASGAAHWQGAVGNSGAGRDHVLAIDRFRRGVTAVPEPGAWATVFAGLGLVTLASRRRR
ncbi:MAG: hypothetical protein GC151_16065 [Betaproteobacteria bacterium]|nr:hypothetical protein [Betaproteobacteria bacterium]